MLIGHESVNGIEILRLEGKLDVHSAPAFNDKIEELARENRVKLILDMKNVKFVSSYGLGSLMTSQITLGEKGGWLKIFNLRTETRGSFEITGLIAKFKVYGTLEEALADVPPAS